MPNKQPENSSSDNQKKGSPAQEALPTDKQPQASATAQDQNQQGVPLSDEQKQKSQAIEKQMRQFEGQLGKKSNTELKKIATQLEVVERNMLLEKIDNELETVKETIVSPGDAAAATAAAGAATVVLNETTT